jgi:hypothetical protein
MTYNFDPDRWYENQRALLVGRRERGEITPVEFAELEKKLVEEYEMLLARVDIRYDYDN